MLTDDWILSNCGTIVHWQTGFYGLYIANIASQLASPPLPCQAMSEQSKETIEAIRTLVKEKKSKSLINVGKQKPDKFDNII